MKKLNINISKAQLTSFTVALKEGKPEVHVTIALLTEAGEPITNYGIGTEAWRADSKFDLPIEIMPMIGDIARVLEAVAVRHCQSGQLALPAPKAKKNNEATLKGFPNIPDGTEVTIKDISDEPINLDDIPF